MHWRLIKTCNKKLRMTSCVFASSFVSISYLMYIFSFTVCIYPPTRNLRGRASTKVSLRFVFSFNCLFDTSVYMINMIHHRSYTRNLRRLQLKHEKKLMSEWDSNLWHLRYRCSALSTELSSQWGAGRFLKLNQKSIVALSLSLLKVLSSRLLHY